MATKNLTVGGALGASIDGLNKAFVLHNVIDHSRAPLAAADVAQVLNIPAGFYVLKAGHTVRKADGTAAAGTLGDGTDPDGYVAASNLNALGMTIGAGALAGGKLYTAADTIDYTATDAVDAAIVDYWAVVIDLN